MWKQEIVFFLKDSLVIAEDFHIFYTSLPDKKILFFFMHFVPKKYEARCMTGPNL